eukprot:scaffold27742_cov29-Prasinocladus_malaysianus.AAC.1
MAASERHEYEYEYACAFLPFYGGKNDSVGEASTSGDLDGARLAVPTARTYCPILTSGMKPSSLGEPRAKLK